MYSDKYKELDKLRGRHKIGITLIIIMILITFVSPFALIFASGYIETAPVESVSGMLIFPSFILGIIIYIFLCYPYNKIKREINDTVKTQLLKTEFDYAFNNTYKEEDIDELRTTLHDMGVFASTELDDCFSVKYNNVRVSRVDADIYRSDDDGTITYFFGPIYIFDTKDYIDGDLYIGSKKKGLLLTTNTIDRLFKLKEYNEVIPHSSYLNDNIVFKSMGNPSIIENATFQQAINKLIDNPEDESGSKYRLVYKNYKLYVFNYNGNNPFEINIDKREDETTSKDKIRTDIGSFKHDLDTILQFKDILSIKEDMF